MSGILQEELDILHKAVGDRGRLIFAMVAGSAAFNLATPTSDRDLFGVYLSNESGPFQAPTESIDSHEPDYAIYGTFHKFVLLLFSAFVLSIKLPPTMPILSFL
jgi:predicted nucleotidyltransferase